ncbi:hypothetical protein FE331_07495 [Dolosigranulum pigrum]|uniref:HK97-gp10 family putative phage morphogenesis protein n=1 Tax=Dolosigranulum pigrum TaxID=29394 RepID=UPI000DD65839|nr:HK97-gp10 family putative phage morphogenesis protein [Dolosigranulum pigrum]QTJ50475.1 hypothetical protein FE331_07495 [Dolosigranulum pigrum]DAX48064.1 MAG TPA: type I neck protein [Caudoviricetes sp.]
MSISVKWTGIEKLSAAISNAHPKAVEQAIKVTQNAGEEGKRIAFQFAPHDTEYLRDHIFTRHQGMESIIESPAGYSGFQEYGTRFMSAQPYMGPMMKYIEPKYRIEMTKAMKGVFK